AARGASSCGRAPRWSPHQPDRADGHERPVSAPVSSRVPPRPPHDVTEQPREADVGDPNTTSRAVGTRPQVDVVLRARDGTPGCDVQLVDLLARMRLEGQRRGWTLHVRSYDGDRLAQLLEVV